MRGRLTGHQTGKQVGAVRNIRLTVAFDGTPYCGWQIQRGQPTIQGALAEALLKVTGAAAVPTGSGRTDAGAHARALVAAFQTGAQIPAAALVRALNTVLPAEIRVLAASDVPLGFHPRRSAKSKTYRYQVYRGPVLPPHLAREHFHYPYPLCQDRVEAAVSLVEGEHDFASFAARSGADREWGPRGTVRHILEARLRSEGSRLLFTFEGDGFLHHMVRNLVGTTLEVGRGRIGLEQFQSLFERRDRTCAGFTAPAKGLILMRVRY